jgi:hypothetical protein
VAHRKLAILRRRLFTVLSVLSLLFCLATLALWVRSYWRDDFVSYGFGSDTKRSWDIHSRTGEAQFIAYYEGAGFRYVLVPGFSWNSSPSTSPSRDLWNTARIRTWFHNGTSGRFLGFGFVTMNWDTGATIRGICAPHWFLVLIFAILPALYVRAVVRSRKRNHIGLCPVCGYDLRATPERCPECGTNATTEPQRR